jgi:acetoin:2,6-dichlorophenolindophenol oxidoreductase subunit alpha
VLEEHGTEWLRLMVRIRLFEEMLADLFERGQLVGVVHLSIGQEATAVGVCSALAPGDQITTTHRGHHHMLARGLEPEPMLAEILGKATGYCRGKGGSMHVACFERGVTGANGIVGGGIPMALGLAEAARTLGTGGVAVSFFGDGAANQGTFHETLNLAALWRAPTIFVCENNGYTEFTPVERVTAGPGIARRAQAYGIPGVGVDGNDIAAVYAAATEAVTRARAGDGPTLLECRTVRRRGHHEGEERYAGTYRDAVEAEDPIDRLEVALAAPDLRAELEAEEAELLGRALAAAQAAPEPSPEAALEDVFA